jgi:hypothetical protein
LVFVDESGFYLLPAVVKTCSPKEHTPVVAKDRTFRLSFYSDNTRGAHPPPGPGSGNGPRVQWTFSIDFRRPAPEDFP